MIRHRWIVLFPVFLGGCFSPAMTIDGRSALEQELTRTAIARAVESLPIHEDMLQGTWKVVVSAPDPQDRDWIESCLRGRLVELGVRISREEQDTSPVVEARVRMAGSDVDNFYFGLPLSLSAGPQVLGFYQSITEYGRARMSLTFWNEDGAIVAQTPEVMAKTHYTTLFFLTLFGPFSSTDLGERTWGRFLELSEDEWREARESGEWILPAGYKSPEEGLDSPPRSVHD